MKKLVLAALFGCMQLYVIAQTVDVYPTHWWAGMKNRSLQLMLHGISIGNASAVTTTYPGLAIKKINKVENKNYLFVDVMLAANIKPGTATFQLKGAPVNSIRYEIKQRRPGNGSAFAQGVTSSDFIYLLMPDRFSNGDPSNDRVPGMKEQRLNRDSIYLRHGGDLQGIINHLDYLQNLGVTTVWPTPVVENDEPFRTEHGYKATNNYKVDPRFGGDEAYKKLSDELHRRKMKLIQDVVYNHVGISHFTIVDMPMKNWVHQWPSFTHPDYKDQTIFDPYGAQIDKTKQTAGWFEPNMPDLNQSNPYVANFLIQNAIWCVEEFGVDGWRIDTYIYVDQDFMNKCNKALLDEYPHITMFGEVWVNGTVNEAYFTENNLNTPFKSNATGVCDFQCLFNGIQPALTKHGDGGNSLYQTLSTDFLYKNPLNNVIFLDNHDMTRFYSQVNEDVDKLKTGIAWLLTTRGTPEMYYGTEVLMKGVSNPDGLVRKDFPGGWQGDKKNAFTKEGLTKDELDVLNYTTTLANFRKTSSALKTGNTMQYVPKDRLYVYFRYDNSQTIMCIMNTTDEQKTIDFTHFSERTNGFTKAKSVIDGSNVNINANASVPAKTMWVLQLEK